MQLSPILQWDYVKTFPNLFHLHIIQKQVHIRVASPPIKYPCYMGINIPTREELIANKLDAPQLAEAVGKFGFKKKKK